MGSEEKTVYLKKRDNRFRKAERQAAKLLGVEITEILWKSYAVYDQDENHLETFHTSDPEEVLVVSSSTEALSAAIVSWDVLEPVGPDRVNERVGFHEIAGAAGIVPPSKLAMKWLEERELQRMRGE